MQTVPRWKPTAQCSTPKSFNQWAFENLEIKPIVNMDVPVTEIGLELAWQRIR